MAIQLKEITKSLCNFQDDCQNYIRVLEVIPEPRTNGSKLLVCGTNAFNPKCRHYGHEATTGQLKVEKEFSGKGFCPYDPRHNSTAIFTGKLYFLLILNNF